MTRTLDDVTTPDSRKSGAPEMRKRPGNLIRRANQLHGSLWSTMVSKEVTPTQFAVLSAIAQAPGTDQIAVSREASLDTSTAADVVFRLIKRGWVRSDRDTADRRRNVLTLTDDGEREFARLAIAAEELTAHFVRNLDLAERAGIVSLLEKILDGD